MAASLTYTVSYRSYVAVPTYINFSLQVESYTFLRGRKSCRPMNQNCAAAVIA